MASTNDPHFIKKFNRLERQQTLFSHTIMNLRGVSLGGLLERSMLQ